MTDLLLVLVVLVTFALGFVLLGQIDRLLTNWRLRPSAGPRSRRAHAHRWRRRTQG